MKGENMTTVEPIRDLKDLRKVEKFLENHIFNVSFLTFRISLL